MKLENTKNDAKERTFVHVLKAPLRVLIKARDFYIGSMLEWSGQMDYGMVLGCPSAQTGTSLPARSFSVNSSKSSTRDDDYKELMRAASTRSGFGSRIGNHMDLVQRQQATRKSALSGAKSVARSYSVGIGRIDEEKACEFVEEIKDKSSLYPRSRSHAVSAGRRRRVF